MQTVGKVAGTLVGLTGLFQIVAGVLIWTGRGLSLIPVHMAVGVVLVLALWTLAIVAIRSHVNARLIAVAFVWGAVVLWFGYSQAQLLPGPNHWIIRVLHLLFGLAAMGQAGALRRQIRMHAPPVRSLAT